MRIHCTLVSLKKKKKQGEKQSKKTVNIDFRPVHVPTRTHTPMHHTHMNMYICHTYICTDTKYVYCFVLICVLIGSIVFVFIWGKGETA